MDAGMWGDGGRCTDRQTQHTFNDTLLFTLLAVLPIHPTASRRPCFTLFHHNTTPSKCLDFNSHSHHVPSGLALGHIHNDKVPCNLPLPPSDTHRCNTNKQAHTHSPCAVWVGVWHDVDNRLLEQVACNCIRGVNQAVHQALCKPLRLGLACRGWVECTAVGGQRMRRHKGSVSAQLY